DKLRESGIETHILPLAGSVAHTQKDRIGVRSLLRLRDAAASLTYVRVLAGFIASNKIDLVHTNSLKADVLGGLAARISHTPVLWHIRDRIDSDYLPPIVV